MEDLKKRQKDKYFVIKYLSEQQFAKLKIMEKLITLRGIGGGGENQSTA